ncbi:ClbS/DfsB family four-helix bundle protein [Phaeocystidibacter luteus]|uniref:ClbS/DfsB family four-helix bundle protein n=1 Tax=Phaeocystidibacter luteus TaxID=911197 RepID=A0A6N6RCQ7_9FLAO|nr:ClbS/DfsB family four-helix bundle protein [Phaeocystidibacter luteus]KAB2805374.1 ClbS/DfsB family four-helix bundle protein [Phaeocystidibacter luteus]
MPRPTTKSELLKASEKAFGELMEMIESMPLERRNAEFQPGTMNRNIRDVLAHIHHWHLLMLDWHEQGMSGTKPEMPAKGYTWRTTSELNRQIWNDYQDVDLEHVLQKLKRSHDAVTSIILQYSSDELFEKKRYFWTGSTSLGAYLTSSTSSHYAWGKKLIKKGLGTSK